MYLAFFFSLSIQILSKGSFCRAWLADKIAITRIMLASFLFDFDLQDSMWKLNETIGEDLWIEFCFGLVFGECWSYCCAWDVVGKNALNVNLVPLFRLISHCLEENNCNFIGRESSADNGAIVALSFGLYNRFTSKRADFLLKFHQHHLNVDRMK